MSRYDKTLWTLLSKTGICSASETWNTNEQVQTRSNYQTFTMELQWNCFTGIVVQDNVVISERAQLGPGPLQRADFVALFFSVSQEDKINKLALVPVTYLIN